MGAGRRRSSDAPATRPRVATLHAVAARAGVSTATVSKALNGIQVSPENLARVLAAADELGYVPNEAARTMRGGPTMTVGIVLHFDIHPRFELMAPVNRMIRNMEVDGYSVFLSVTAGTGNVDTLLRRYAERRVDGLFYWNAEDAPSLDLYRRAGIPVLAIGFRDEGCEDLPMLTVDSSDAYRQLYRKLAKLGHRVVHEIDPGQSASIHESTAAEVGIEWRPVGLPHEIAAVHDVVRSLTTEATPIALLAPYPVILDIFAVCDDLGLEIPRDVSLVSTTDSPGAALLRTPVAAIRTDWERIGEATARAMLNALKGEPLRDEVVPDCVEFVDRASLGPGPRRRQRVTRS
jgi:LacI family transcriptional regulator